LLAAAAVSRRRTTRHVTLQDVENLTIKQVPKWFRPKISIGMARRGAVVKAIRKQLDQTFFLMAYNKDGTDCASLRKSRALFPDGVVVRSLKNSLVKKAMERTEWEEFGKNLKGSLMYVFVMDDNDVKTTVQAYLKLEKDYKRADNVARVYETVKNQVFYEPRPLIGGCLRDEWKLIGPEEFVKLKDFPTKTELIGRIAGSIKQVTQKLAVGVKQVPQKLAIGTKKIVEKMEEDGKATVGDVVA